MSVKVQLDGFSEAEQLLRRLSDPHVQNNAHRSAVRLAGRVVARTAQALASRMPHSEHPDSSHGYESHLMDEVAVSVKEGNTVYAVVGPRRPGGWYGHIVEGASEKHPGGMAVQHHSHGQPTGAILRKHDFVYAAADITKTEQMDKIVDTLRRWVKSQGG